ncbi:hypothetical protein [Salinilacihabitans rarus]|uniref:hypothetical protein n=1 Tax=Salinilacihabitans rarus TaxID=2961596 RepID=UPI0020C8F1D7|nr:hypothetical protein [Salinilacihabitans rarus]
MITTHESRPAAARSPPLALRAYVLGAVALGLSALYGGLALMLRRASDPLGMPLEWLDRTPFRDYFVPGLTLFTVFGVGSAAVLFGIARRRPWAWPAAVGLGLAQVCWIAVEVTLLRLFQPLHLAYGGLGAALVALATRPSVREFLTDDGEGAGRRA